MLSDRCWGVAIDDASDRGADAEVLAIGASLDPRPLRGIATDPKARRSDYEVGSAAWIRLLANGGKQDIGTLWSGVDRVPTMPVPVATDIAPVPGAVVDLVTVDELAPAIESPQIDLPSPPPSQASGTPAFDLQDMTSIELAVLITARYRTIRQALRAASLLAARQAWPDLERSVDMVCRSYQSADQLVGLHLIRRYHTADPNMRPAVASLVRALAREPDARVAALAMSLLAQMAPDV